jgi:hypothetical protein
VSIKPDLDYSTVLRYYFNLVLLIIVCRTLFNNRNDSFLIIHTVLTYRDSLLKQEAKGAVMSLYLDLCIKFTVETYEARLRREYAKK